MAVADTTAVGGATGATATGRARMVDSYDTFMKLLTTQMKNQDPLSPMDSTQFTQQLVQMTSVEQQLLTNDLLEKVIQNTGSGIQTAISLLGREVTAAGDQTTIRGGQANWSYDLGKDAAMVKLEVLDAAGNTLHATTIDKADELKAGQHSFNWNGKDLAGKQLPDGGPYTLRITATDSDLKAVETTTRIKGVVTGVEQADGKTLITVNGVKLQWEKVTSVAQVSSEAPPAEDDPEPETNPDEQTPSSAAA